MEKYLLIEWPESQEFMDNEECYPCVDLDGAYFVPESTYETLLSKNCIQKQYSKLNDDIYDYLYTKLQNTSKNNPLECDITLESPEDCGLSSLELPSIVKIWMNSDEDMMFEYDGGRITSFDAMYISDLIQIVEEL